MTTSTSEAARLSRDELIARLRALSQQRATRTVWIDSEADHATADNLLVAYINDAEVTEAYEDVGKWYA